MSHLSDHSLSAALDLSRCLDLLDDGLEGDVLPEEDVSPAGAGGVQAPALLVDGGYAGPLMEDMTELERERRAQEWHDLAPVEGAAEDDVLAEPEPPPPPPPDYVGEVLE